jgi:hypothetical protein
VHRSFGRIRLEKVPDAKTLVRLGQAVGPKGIRELHDRLMLIAQEHKVIRGKMRVDTKVVESNSLHHRQQSTTCSTVRLLRTDSLLRATQKFVQRRRHLRPVYDSARVLRMPARTSQLG